MKNEIIGKKAKIIATKSQLRGIGINDKMYTTGLVVEIYKQDTIVEGYEDCFLVKDNKCYSENMMYSIPFSFLQIITE